MKKEFLALLFMSLAAAAFAAGRWSTPTDVAAEVHPPQSVPALVREESPAPLPSPREPHEVGRLPFAVAYQFLSTASREEISRWLDEIVQIRASPTRTAALSSFFKVLVQIDAAVAKDLFLRLGKDDRWPAMYAIKAAAPPRAAGELVEVLRTFDMLEISSCSHNLLADAIEEWSEVDPEAVRQYIERDADGEMRRYGDTLLRSWAAHDSAAAYAWMMQEFDRIARDGRTDYGPTSDRSQLLQSFVEGWFQADRRAAVDYTVSISESEEVKNSSLLGSLTQGLFDDSPEEARAFILRLKDEQHPQALRGVGWWSLRFGMDPGPHRWPPSSAIEWLLQFDAEARAEAMQQVLTQWHYGNAGELYRWLDTVPADRQEVMMAQYRPNVAKETAAEEVRLALAVENVALREKLLPRLMRGGEQAREELTRALALSGLGVEKQRELISLIPEKSYVEATETEDDE